MKIRKLSNKELEKSINSAFILGCIYLFVGVIAAIFSIKHYWFGFMGVSLILIGLWLLNTIMHDKTILEIRSRR